MERILANKTIKNVAFILLVILSGCAFKSGPEIKEYIGKYKVCSPEEYIQKNFPNQNPYSALDSFSIKYYQLNENKIKGSTLEIFADTTFVVSGEILNDTSGVWKMHHSDEMGSSLKLRFNRVNAVANFHYEREGYRICIFPLSTLKERIPITEVGPRRLKLVYKKEQ